MTDTFDGSNSLAEAVRNNIVAGIDAAQAGATTVYSYADGAMFPAVTSGYGEVLLQTALSSAVTLPASYPVLYDSLASSATVIGGGGTDQAVDANSGGLTFQFFGGGGVAYTANTPANGVPATGDTLFLDGSGPAYVAAGEGNDTVVVDSGSNYVAVGAGASEVFLDGGSNVVATEGNDQIVVRTNRVAAAGDATISLSGNSTVYGGSSPLLLLNGSGSSQLIPQIDSVSGAQLNTGSVTVFGGQGGGAYYGGTDGNNAMLAGNADTTLVGGGTADVLYAMGPGNDMLQAVGDNTFLVGSAGTGNNQYIAGAGTTLIYGGSGQDTFIAGTGTGVMQAGTGADQFDFTAGAAGGLDAIFGFKVGVDQVNLFSYDNGDGSAAANALDQAAVNASGGSTYVTLSDHTTIYFVGISALASNSFVG